jgi:hypothetical protein
MFFRSGLNSNTQQYSALFNNNGSEGTKESCKSFLNVLTNLKSNRDKRTDTKDTIKTEFLFLAPFNSEDEFKKFILEVYPHSNFISYTGALALTLISDNIAAAETKKGTTQELVVIHTGSLCFTVSIVQIEYPSKVTIIKTLKTKLGVQHVVMKLFGNALFAATGSETTDRKFLQFANLYMTAYNMMLSFSSPESIGNAVRLTISLLAITDHFNIFFFFLVRVELGSVIEDTRI